MIKIAVGCDGENVYDEFEHENTTLLENAMIVRRLEEIKLKLLSFDYQSKFEVSEGSEVDEDDDSI